MRQHRGSSYERVRREREINGRRNRRGLSPRSLAITVLLILFILGGLYFGCIFITTVFSWLPIPRPSVPIIGDQSGNVPSWKGSERVNILLLGIDQRVDEKGQPARSDTMIIATIDPKTKSAGMISLPRDLWVPITGHGENKINTAHFFGEVDKPGNGPLLAKKTVQDLLGIPIHYYIRVDFQGFEKLVDMIGGINVDVERPLRDNEYPTEDYGIKRIYIPAGIQYMNGKTALEYARSRHSDNDYSRNQRQRQVILAARQQALQLNLLPKLPGMLDTITQSVKTDLSPTDLLALARLIREVDSNSVVTGAIDDSMVNDVNRDGTVLTLKRQEANKLINEVFFGYRIKQEAAKIEVQNGTGRTGLAASVSNQLKNAGYSVVKIGNASMDYKETVVIDYSGKKATVDAVAGLLNISPKNIRTVASPEKTDVDILIILGQDTKVQ